MISIHTPDNKLFFSCEVCVESHVMQCKTVKSSFHHFVRVLFWLQNTLCDVG